MEEILAFMSVLRGTYVCDACAGQTHAELLGKHYSVMGHFMFVTKLDIYSIVLILVLHMWFYFVAIYGKRLTLNVRFYYVKIKN
jgi:hypothetical protein